METTVRNEKKRSLGIAIALGAVVLLGVLFFAYLLPNVIRPAKQYEQARSLLAAERYEEAMAAFTALNGYKDSAAQIVVCQNALKDRVYDEAIALYESGQYEGAIAAFTTLIGYRDSAAQIDKCQYALRDRAYDAAVALRKAAQYEEAISAFLALNGHRDSVEQIELCKKDRAYDAAVALYDAGQYEDAITAFEALEGYRDSAAQIERCSTAILDRAYDAAVALYDAGQYEDAIAAFEALEGYRDSAAQIERCSTAILDRAYNAAVALYDAGQYEDAIAAFEALSGHRDSAAQIERCSTAILDRAYNAAAALRDAGQYEEAIAAFEALNGHRDSAAQIEACNTAILNQAYDAAAALYEAGRFEDATAAFEALNGYRDSAQQIEACQTAIKDREYNAAVALYEGGQYEIAIWSFEALDGYRDSAAQIEKCRTAIKDRAYDAAMTLYTSWQYEKAIAAFEALDGYRDSAAWVDICRRDMARWPNRPVNVIVPASAGGSIDNIIRLLAERFQKKTGRSILITNITGSAGYETARQADADGYNFICGTINLFTYELNGNLSYGWDEYEMVAFCSSPFNSYCVAVRADSPYQTILDLLDAAKANPYALTGGVAMTGQPRMIVDALQSAIGYDLHLTDVGYSYEGNAALLGGHVDWILSNCPSCDPYVQSGDFRLLAVCGDVRYPTDPDVPTFKEMGVDFSFPARPLVWLAPKGTSAEACEAFNRILREISEDPEYQEKMVNMLKSPVDHVPDIEESVRQAQAYRAMLAGYAVPKPTMRPTPTPAPEPVPASTDLPAITPGSCQLPVILTSVGQSADVDIVATHCKKIKLNVDQNNTIKAEELTGKYKTIILAVGGSNKGLGAAGIDADQELARTDALIKKAKELGITVIAMHVGGADRRGTLSDSFIKPAFAAADIAIIVESGDTDDLMHDILAANHTPTAYVAKSSGARDVLKSLFGL